MLPRALRKRLKPLEPNSKILVAGLGNPGPEYRDTRHNAGFMVADAVAASKKAGFVLERYAYYTEFTHKGRHVFVIKPSTYMNDSGKAVAHWTKVLKIDTGMVLVILDDIALPFGTLRLKPKGGDAGHNGLKSIEIYLKTKEYPRLRFGVGDNFARGQQVDYVLSGFSGEEQKSLPLLVDEAAQIILSFVEVGPALTMTRFNR